MKLLSYEEAAAALKQGQVIAYPTEGVYGFAADAMNEAAVENVLSLKGRSASKGFIVMAASLEKLSPLIKPLTAMQTATLLESKRGGFRYTWIVPAQDHCPEYLRGQFTTLAVRVTNHPDARALCDLMPVGVVSTSANLHKEAPLFSVIVSLALWWARLVDYRLQRVSSILKRVQLFEHKRNIFNKIKSIKSDLLMLFL